MSADDLILAAQREWASLGGLGPVPTEVARRFIYKLDEEAARNARAEATRVIAQQRHELRLRLIERTFPALLVHARGLSSRRGELIVDGHNVGPNEWANQATLDGVDGFLDRLAAEAKAGANCPKGWEPFTIDDVRPCANCDAEREVAIDEGEGLCLPCFQQIHAEYCGCAATLAPADPQKSQLFFAYEAQRRDGSSYEDAMRASVEPYRAYMAEREST